MIMGALNEYPIKAPILRDYQLSCVESVISDLETNDKVMIKLPTGAGKTVISAEIIKRLLNDSIEQICFIAHRVSLINQTYKSFLNSIPAEQLGIVCHSIGLLQTERKVVIATYQTLTKFDCKFDYLIVDEAHKFFSENLQNFVDKSSKKVIYQTATPYDSMGMLYGENKEIKRISFDVSLNDMIERKFLVPIIFKQGNNSFDASDVKITAGDYNVAELEKLTDDQKIHTQIDDALSRMAGRKKVVWNCISIKHAERVNSRLIELGESSVCIHSELDCNQQLQRDFELNCRHLVNVALVIEGYDFPAIDCVVLMRPTRSPQIYVQSIGRGLRLSEGKNDCLVLDYGEVVKFLGHPNGPKIRQKGDRFSKKITYEKICPKCSSLYFSRVSKCDDCGFDFRSIEKVNLESTTVRAFTPGEIERKEVVVRGWEICDYIAKSGRKCVKIVYKIDNIFISAPMEFIPIDSFWFSKIKMESNDFNLIPSKIILERKPYDQYFNVVKRFYDQPKLRQA